MVPIHDSFNYCLLSTCMHFLVYKGTLPFCIENGFRELEWLMVTQQGSWGWKPEAVSLTTSVEGGGGLYGLGSRPWEGGAAGSAGVGQSLQASIPNEGTRFSTLAFSSLQTPGSRSASIRAKGRRKKKMKLKRGGTWEKGEPGVPTNDSTLAAVPTRTSIHG